MSSRRWLAGQFADQGRREFRIGSGRFSLIACNLSSCRSRACAIKSVGMQPCHIHGLPQRQLAASHSQPQQAILASTALPGQLLQRLRGVRRICNSMHSGATVLWQGRSFSSCCRVGGPFSTYSSRPLGFSSFHTAPHHGSQQSGLQQQLHRGQPQGMAALRAAFTSDAATQRVHLPQHLKDASLRKQASPRSNAYSSAVAQARAGFGGSGYAQSQQLAEATRPAGTYSEHVAQPMGGAKENLAHDEQVQRLEGALAAGASASVEGTIQNVTYKDEKSGYTVLKVAALHTAGAPPEQRRSAAQRQSRRINGVDPKTLVTVVGDLPHAVKGQQLRFVGDWMLHPKHSWQLKATAYEEVVPQSRQAVAAYLASTIKGVGYAKATRMVDHYGTNMLAIMDSPDCVQQLSKVPTIGHTLAVNFKKHWDASRELREMRQYVKNLGLTGRLAQTLVERHGKDTKARLEQDPYFCLHGLPGVTFRVAEDLAWAVGAPIDLPSRGAVAFLHTLQLAADKAGHTHLPWGVLLMHTQRLLAGTGRPWKDEERLKEIGARLQKSGHIVVEDPAAELQTEPSSRELMSLPQNFYGDSSWDGALGQRASSSGGTGESQQDQAVRKSLELYITSRIQGVGPNRAAQLVGKHGAAVPDILNGTSGDSMRMLTDIPGIGTKTAEKMLRSWELNVKRIGPWKAPSTGDEQEMGSPQGRSAADSPDGDLQWPWDPASRCYLAGMHDTEVRVAAALSRIAAQGDQSFEGGEERVLKWDKARRDREKSSEGKERGLSEGQKAAVMRASRAPLIVLTGGPGCGKTFATKAIVQLWQSQQKDVRLAAPTGRAAERLQTEASAKSTKATTIHRLLNYKSWSQRRQGADKDSAEESNGDLEGFFACNADSPLDAPSGKLSILVDETSMLDMSLAGALLDAIPTNMPVQLLLVGDADQLPPVSAGSFLSAAIDSGMVPVVDLREVFRQAQGSDIVKAAHAVHAGLMPPLTRIDPSQPSKESQGKQALWVAPDSLADIEDEVVRTVQSSIMSDRGVDVKTDLQVLTPMRKGPAGVQNLNARLQALINPPEKGRGEIRVSSAADSPQILRVGDRVIQSVNNYDKEVFNGDPGYIMSVDAAARRVRVRYPSSGSDKGSGRDVEYAGAELWEIELAWATTVHKAQGSESKAVVVVLSPAHRPLLTRRLFYTAITRAREAVVVVGSEAAIRTALQGTQGDVRLTSLHARLAAAAARLGLPATAPVVYGQGFASGPVDEAVSQTVSESVEKAQEQQHLDDLAASTRAQQEAVQELSSSSSSSSKAAIYNNGGSRPAGQQEMAAAGLSSSRVQQEAVQELSSRGSGSAAGGSKGGGGSHVQPPPPTTVVSLHPKSGAIGSADSHGSADEAELEAEPSDAIAGGQPPGAGLQQPMAGTPGRAHEGQPSQAARPMPATAPSHHALGGRSLQQARKAGSLQGARLPRAEKPESTHPTM